MWAENEAAKKKNKVTKPCLLQANIFCNDDEFLDLNIEENMAEMERTILPFWKKEKKDILLLMATIAV